MNLPTYFINTVTSTWGKRGVQWLQELPSLIEFFRIKWQLSDIVSFDNLSYNYVARAYSSYHNSCVALKIGIPSIEFNNEGKALEFYAGRGCVKLLAHDYQNGGMLMPLIKPGITLRSFFPDKEKQAIKYTCHVMKKLYSHPISAASNFSTIDTWFSLFNTLEIPQELKQHVKKANQLAHELKITSQEQRLLHGDLHHDNILLDESDSWIAIDPKGVIGETAYEVGAFMCNPAELAAQPSLSSLLAFRLDEFSKTLDINRQRLAQACYVRIILSVCWTLQDNGNWHDDITIAQHVLQS